MSTHERLSRLAREGDFAAAHELTRLATRNGDLTLLAFVAEGLIRAGQDAPKDLLERCAADLKDTPDWRLLRLHHDLRAILTFQNGWTGPRTLCNSRFLVTRREAWGSDYHLWGRDLASSHFERVLLAAFRDTYHGDDVPKTLAQALHTEASRNLPGMPCVAYHAKDVPTLAFAVPDGVPLTRAAPLSEPQAVALALAIAQQMQRYHEQGISLTAYGAHPEAIYVSAPEEPRFEGLLTGWNTILWNRAKETRTPGPHLPFPITWNPLQILPPESFHNDRSKMITPASDVITLGFLLRYALEARPIFPQLQGWTIMDRILAFHQLPWPPFEKGSPALTELVERAMKREPRERIGFEAHCDALEALPAPPEREEAPPTREPLKKRRWWHRFWSRDESDV